MARFHAEKVPRQPTHGPRLQWPRVDGRTICAEGFPVLMRAAATARCFKWAAIGAVRWGEGWPPSSHQLVARGGIDQQSQWTPRRAI